MSARIEWECLANAGYNVGNQECIFANLLDIARLTQDIEHTVKASTGHLFPHVE